jgi:hypothetical protein
MAARAFYFGLTITCMYCAASLLFDIPSTLRAHAVCFLYIVLSTCADLCIKSSSEQWHAFDPAVLTLIGESIKLVITLMLIVAGWVFSEGEGSPFPSSSDVLLSVPPAALYTMSNIMLFYFISRVDVGTFGIIRETCVIWVGIWWVAFFGVDIGIKRKSALCCMCLIQVASGLMRNKLDLSSLWVFVCPAVSTLASVANEAALKQTLLGINQMNAILYSLCAFFSGLYVVMVNQVLSSSPLGVLSGMNVDCVYIIALQCAMGLFISRILKYANAITKQACVAVRGPILISAYAILQQRMVNTLDMITASMVAGCAVYYIFQGPIKMDQHSHTDSCSNKS